MQATRKHSGDIVDGQTAYASHINDELDNLVEVINTNDNNVTSLTNNTYTKAEVDSKVNSVSSSSDKVVQAGTVFPTGGLIDGQEFYKNDERILYLYDAGTATWVPQGGGAGLNSPNAYIG